MCIMCIKPNAKKSLLTSLYDSPLSALCFYLIYIDIYYKQGFCTFSGSVLNIIMVINIGGLKVFQKHCYYQVLILGLYKCDLCDVTFPFKSKLEKHKATKNIMILQHFC